ncbi:MAG: hypothetical protein HXY36_06400 [Chloroflexi bacterium]|nr:hypothetical protein [Chloroflexota bacterium]NWF78201.1 hypothetical protein [Chloroflexota bacterium]
MSSSGYREEVFNVLLALLLHERCVVIAPEQSFRQALQERRHVPDVLVVYRGLRTVIEGKVADKLAAAEKALLQARDRVVSGVAHVGIALLYPAAIRKIPSFSELQGFLSSCTFKVAVCTETGETGWTEGGLDYLADVLRGTFEQLIREDAVVKAVDVLNAGIDEFARLVFTSPATINRAAEILGICEVPKRSRKKSADEEL